MSPKSDEKYPYMKPRGAQSRMWCEEGHRVQSDVAVNKATLHLELLASTDVRENISVVLSRHV